MVYLIAIVVATAIGAIIIIMTFLSSPPLPGLGIVDMNTTSAFADIKNNSSIQHSINNNHDVMTGTSLTRNMTAAASIATNTTATISTISSTNAPNSNLMMRMGGMLASIQQNDKNQPAWIIAGHWWLDSDRPLMMINSDEDTSDTATTSTLKPHITNFTALIYAIADADGASFHTYKLSNFAQTSITTQKDTKNSVMIYGTFTLTSDEERSINSVHGYITIINNKIELWINTHAHTQDRFDGPTTTITGIVSITMT